MRKERGSITLFVLVAMILIIGVLAIIYIKTTQKNSNQLQQIEKIQEEYQSQNIEQEYRETIGKKEQIY